MRLAVPAVFLLLAVPAAAEDWLTIYGYPELPGTDVIQISPVVTGWQRQATFEVRVSRKAERTGYGDVRYRSYSGMSVVDCESRKGWFLTLTFYGQPDWGGEALGTSSFRPEEAPMAFADIPGAPAARLVGAACAVVR